MKLYLDDIRIPRTNGWVVVRSYDEFINHIEKNGLPEEMSLDHDLGEDTPTGYDCVRWMVYEKQLDLRKTKINIHSANPVGEKNMEKLINNWIKHLNNQDNNELTI